MTTETNAIPFHSPYTQMETQLTLRLLSQGWTPDQIVNDIESLRVTAPDVEHTCATCDGVEPLCWVCRDDADELYAARDRVRDRLIDEGAR